MSRQLPSGLRARQYAVPTLQEGSTLDLCNAVGNSQGSADECAKAMTEDKDTQPGRERMGWEWVSLPVVVWIQNNPPPHTNTHTHTLVFSHCLFPS